MKGCILFLSDGQLGAWQEGRASILTSQRQAKYEETIRSLEEKYEWKTSGAGARFMEQHNPYHGAGNDSRITAIAPFKSQLLYAITTGESGGLYTKDPLNDAALEGLRYSDRNFTVRDMDAKGDLIACAMDTIRGECHITLFKEGAPGCQTVTQGDTVDTSPWLTQAGGQIYYASAGYARDEAGRILAKGPSAILKLDLQTGALDEIRSDDQYDYLRPKQGPDGALYMIRRPYGQPRITQPNALDRLRNAGSVLRGLVRFFKAIGKAGEQEQPTAQASRGQVKQAPQRRMLEGVWVELSQDAPDKAEGEKGCVPDSWKLVRLEEDGSLTEVQQGVADYDFDGDALIYSDGRRILRLAAGKRTLLYRGLFIPRLAVMKASFIS